MSKAKNNAFWFVQHKPVFGVLFVGLGIVFARLSAYSAKQEKEGRKM